MQAISTQLLNPIMLTETSRVERSSTRNMSAWLLTQQAIRQYYITTSGSERVSSTQPLLTQALKFDANYAPALALKGLIHCTSILIHQSKNIVADRKLAKSSCEKAYQLAPMDPSVLWCCGVTWCFLESTERGLPLLGKSIEMDPNNAHAIADYGYQLCRAGRSEEGIECIERAFKHSPKDPRHHIWTFFLGYAHASDVPKALEFFKQSINLDASYIPPWIGRLLAQLALQQLEEAKITAKHLQVLSPGINKESVLRQFASGGSQDPAMLDFYMELLGRTRLFE
jgi:tetratricopeptide (TPR) repeat protein